MNVYISKPEVSVIMPVHNGEYYLSRSIESILNQTFNNFEFIIINNGSTDNSWKIIKKYALKDKRIYLVNLPKKGIVKALNMGCRLARGKYIARMDCDDVSQKTRLKDQYDFLESHRQVGVVGSWADVYINDRYSYLWKTAENDYFIRWHMLFNNTFPHASVMVERDLLKKAGYF